MATIIFDRADVTGAQGQAIPTDGITINAYKASRFTLPVAQGASPPGAADAGPVTSGTTYGAHGNFEITVPTVEQYMCSFQQPGNPTLGWGGPYLATLAAGTVASVTATDTTIVVSGTASNPTIGVGTILNAQIGSSAAIAKSKLVLGIVDADVASGAAIAKAKLAALNISDADVAVGAGIAASKLAIAPLGASVLTSETTSSTSYGDLTTVGPSVTVTTGNTAMVTVSGVFVNNTANGLCLMGFAISGASVSGPNDNSAAIFQAYGANAEGGYSYTMQVTGLTPGANTFTAKYRVSAGTGTFLNRRIVVVPG